MSYIKCLTDPNNPGEAIHLARDFGYVCETEFPARQVKKNDNALANRKFIYMCGNCNIFVKQCT